MIPALISREDDLESAESLALRPHKCRSWWLLHKIRVELWNTSSDNSRRAERNYSVSQSCYAILELC